MANILVLGATGKIGDTLVRELLGKGARVHALVRDTAKAQAQVPDGVTLHQGDVDKVETIRAVLSKASFERLFLLTNSFIYEGSIAQAAKAAGVKQIVKISCWLANRDEEPGSLFSAHARAEDEISRVGIPWVFLRPADFTQNLIGSATGVKHMGKLFHAYGNAQIASIDTRDIAECAAAVLLADPARHNYRTYTLTGPEALTRVEVAEVISKITDKKIESVHVGDVALKHALETQAKLPEHYAFLVGQLSICYRRLLVGNAWTTDNVELLTGKKPRTIAAFVEENKALFA